MAAPEPFLDREEPPIGVDRGDVGLTGHAPPSNVHGSHVVLDLADAYLLWTARWGLRGDVLWGRRLASSGSGTAGCQPRILRAVKVTLASRMNAFACPSSQDRRRCCGMDSAPRSRSGRNSTTFMVLLIPRSSILQDSAITRQSWPRSALFTREVNPFVK